jgi:hypothetical protein
MIGIELLGSLMVIGLIWILPDFKRRLIVCIAIVVWLDKTGGQRLPWE